MKNIKLFEEFINEMNNKLGAKATKFRSLIKDHPYWEWFTDPDSAPYPKEYHNGLKKLGINDDNAIVVLSGLESEALQDILSAAKKAGIKYVEVKDPWTGAIAIIFDGTK